MFYLLTVAAFGGRSLFRCHLLLWPLLTEELQKYSWKNSETEMVQLLSPLKIKSISINNFS